MTFRTSIFSISTLLLTPILFSKRCYLESGREIDDDFLEHACTLKGNFVPGCSELKIFPGSASKDLAKEIAKYLGTELGKAEISRFADGEVKIEILEETRGKDIYIIQSCAAPVNETILEILFLASALNRCNSKRVTAVIPYFGYKHRRRGSPINASINSRFIWSHATDFATMLKVVGINRVIAVDFERPGQGHEACFFDSQLQVESVISTDLGIDYFNDNIIFQRPVVIVSPHSECIKLAHKFQKSLKSNVSSVKLATIAIDPNLPDEGAELIGNVSGYDVIIVDDFIETGRTLNLLTKKLKEHGAEDIYAFASHILFNDQVLETIENSDLKQVVVTDTLPLPPNSNTTKIKQISVAERLAQVIMADHFKSHLYNHEELLVNSQFS